MKIVNMLVITEKELIECRIPKNYIVDKLIEKGFPIDLKRNNVFDVSEYSDKEVIVKGHLEVTRVNGSLVYKSKTKKEKTTAR